MARSTSPGVSSPSATRAKASSRSAPCKRFIAKPGVSAASTTGDCPMPAINARARSTAAAAVAGPGTISTAGTRWGGLSGCATSPRSGRQARAKISDGIRAEVELAITASSWAAASTAATRARLASAVSAMHSCTKAAPSTASVTSSAGRMRAATAPASCPRSRPIGARRPASSAAHSAAAAAAPSRASARRTDRPPRAKASAQDRPMRPAPMTATVSAASDMSSPPVFRR